MRPYKIERDKPIYMGKCACGIWLRTEERFRTGMCAKCYRKSQRPQLDPDADGKQWKYRGWYIMDQRGYSSGLPPFCIMDGDGGKCYPASSLKDGQRIIDERIAQP